MSKVEQIEEKRNGKTVTMEYRYAVTRKLRRQALKNKQGNNRIGDAWAQEQLLRKVTP